MDWLNYHHLYYFWLVYTEGGFSKAAQRLRISQSSVSLQVSKLEEFLGEKLMERGPRGFKLTEAGQVAIAQAEEIFRQGNDLVQYFRSGQMKASFRLGALGGLSKNLQHKLLFPVIENKDVELLLEVGDAEVLLERLLSYQLDAMLSDVAFASSEAEPLTQIEIASEPVCIVSRKLSKSDLGAAFKKAGGGIYFPAKSSPLTSAIMEYLTAEKIQFTPRGFVDDIAFLRLLALETDALVAIPRIGVKREIEAEELSVVYQLRKIRQPYFLVHRSRGKRHPMLAKVIHANG